MDNNTGINPATKTPVQDSLAKLDSEIISLEASLGLLEQTIAGTLKDRENKEVPENLTPQSPKSALVLTIDDFARRINSLVRKTKGLIDSTDL